MKQQQNFLLGEYLCSCFRSKAAILLMANLCCTADKINVGLILGMHEGQMSMCTLDPCGALVGRVQRVFFPVYNLYVSSIKFCLTYNLCYMYTAYLMYKMKLLHAFKFRDRYFEC